MQRELCDPGKSVIKQQTMAANNGEFDIQQAWIQFLTLSLKTCVAVCNSYKQSWVLMP